MKENRTLTQLVKALSDRLGDVATYKSQELNYRRMLDSAVADRICAEQQSGKLADEVAERLKKGESA